MVNWPWQSDGEDEPEEIELVRIAWDEDVEVDYTVITERLVWPGGAEREVEHTPQHGRYIPVQGRFYDIDGDPVIDLRQEPAYSEELDRKTVTRTETKRRSAYIEADGHIPPGVEVREGDYKYVTETDD